MIHLVLTFLLYLSSDPEVLERSPWRNGCSYTVTKSNLFIESDIFCRITDSVVPQVGEIIWTELRMQRPQFLIQVIWMTPLALCEYAQWFLTKDFLQAFLIKRSIRNKFLLKQIKVLTILCMVSWLRSPSSLPRAKDEAVSRHSIAGLVGQTIRRSPVRPPKVYHHVLIRITSNGIT